MTTSAADAPAQTECLCGSRDFRPVRRGRFGFFPIDGRPVPFGILRCRRCRLLVTDPRPAAHIAYLEANAAVAPAIDADPETLVATSRHRLARIRATMGVPGAVLEIGCSTGALVEMLARAGAARSIGVELHPPAVALARRLGRDVRDRPLQDCGFPAASFDLVHAHHVLEHVPALPELLSEMHRLLRPGGQVYFTVPCCRSPFAWSDDWPGWFPQEHFWHFEAATLARLLRGAGFEPLATTRPLLTDFVRHRGAVGRAKTALRALLRDLRLGDTLEVWARARPR